MGVIDSNKSRAVDTFLLAADAVARVLAANTNWGASGVREGQYAADLVADDVALRLLRAAGFGVLSEESGLEGADRQVVVVVDPGQLRHRR